uniref:Uncharacterized protein n=1 Tax=Spongospora subterranea TaxID=70186 RepID=A0A0H5QPM9_9EUKA|eukprot:CRZ03326.1 hypothetical protein [Spongospora subterranea]
MELPRAAPVLIDTYVKSSYKMKRRYLTQRFMYDINRKRVEDQLRKRFGRPRPRGNTSDSRSVSFIMTIEASYALRRLVRIERCYLEELLQPLPNRVTQVVKIQLFSMRRAFLFLNEVAFRCQPVGDAFAFMIPSGYAKEDFDGSTQVIDVLTKGYYQAVPGPHLPHWNDPQVDIYAFDDCDGGPSAMPLRQSDLVFILNDRHEHTYSGVEDQKVCHWYFVLSPDDVYRGLKFRVSPDSWVPVRGRYGWVPSTCILVHSPVLLQYSLNTLKFKLESPRLLVDPDGVCQY